MYLLKLVTITRGVCKDSIIPLDCDGFLYRIVIPWEDMGVIMMILYILITLMVVASFIKSIADLKGHRISERGFVRFLSVFILCINSILWMSTLYWYFGLPISFLTNILIMKIFRNYEKTYQMIDTLSIDELKDRGFFGFAFWQHKQKQSNFLSLSIPERHELLSSWVGPKKDLPFFIERIVVYMVPALVVAVFFLLNIGYLLF